MIQTCRSNIVRDYVDEEVNYMTRGGNDVKESHKNGKGEECAARSLKNC